MKKLLLFVLNILIIQYASFAQANLVRAWDYRYGGVDNEKLESFQQTAEGGYIMGGTSTSDETGDKSEPTRGGDDYWVVKTDRFGVKEWDRRFGGSLDDELHSVIQTTDGGYLLGGNSRSGISGDKTQANWDAAVNPSTDFWIVKLDASGNKLWDKRYGGLYADDLFSVIQTSDGGYMLGGFSISGITGDKTQTCWGSGPDYWVVKIDALGNKQWDKRYGGTKNDQLYSMVQSNDGGYLFGGFSWSEISGDKTQANQGAINYCDYWIVKTDASGIKQWDKRFGGNFNDQLDVLKKTADGGYVLAGYSWSDQSGDKSQPNFGPPNTSDYWVVKIDVNGNLKWEKTIGGNDRENDFGSIYQTNDKGYTISGTSYSNISGCKTENNYGIEQSWVVKMDSSGNQQWDKTIFTNGHDEASMAILSSDGSVVMANYSNGGIGGFKTQANHDTSIYQTYDFWIVKLVNPVAPQALYSSDAGSICAGSCVNFTNLSLNGDTYQWMFNGASTATSTAMNPQGICYPVAGNYSVTLIATNAFGSDTITLPNFVTVLQGPQPFSVSNHADSLFAPQGLGNYQWYFYNTLIPGATDYFLVATQSGTYGVLVTDVNGCETGSSILIVNTGVKETSFANDDFDIFPNPAGDYFILTLSTEKAADRKIEVYNSVGQSVFESNVFAHSGKTKFEINSENFARGIYILKITEGENVMMKRVVIDK